MIRRIFSGMAVLTLLAFGASGQVYVDAALASGANDGSSWADAYQGAAGLQAGLDDASGGDVYVAAGTYDPITLASGDVAYGGFANGDAFGDRDPGANATIIDGGGAATGVIAIGVQNTVLDGFTIENCAATTDIAAEGDPVLVGGGLYYSACDNTNTLQSLTVTGNSAGNGGGGAYFGASAPAVMDCVFDSNTIAASSGGGVSSSGCVGIVFSNCTFSNNTAVAQGAGAIDVSSQATYDGCTFTGNTATAGGGGLFSMAGACDVMNCTFTNNTASWVGGGLAMWSEGPWTVTNTEFIGNSGQGGGLRIQGNSSPNDTATVAGCTFSNNVGAGNSGSGAEIQNNDAIVVTDCVFTGGTGTRGALLLGTAAVPGRIVNCLFYGNGGSIGGAFNTGAADYVNCTFAGNESTTQTFVGWGDGTSAPNFINTIIWGNNPVSGADAYGEWSGGVTASATYSAIESGWAGGGEGNIAADPMFVDIPNNDYRLDTSSPALDTGNANIPPAPDHDLLGDPRPGAVAGVSMGAFEEGPPAAPTITEISNVTILDGVVLSRVAVASGSAPITWALLSPSPAPGDMTIGAETGLFTWTANITESPVDVVIEATNAFGTDTEEFRINVDPEPIGLPLAAPWVMMMLAATLALLGVAMLRRRAA